MKIKILITAVIMLALGMTACGNKPAADVISEASSAPEVTQKESLRIASLTGPTTMGMIKLVHDNETSREYGISIYGTADEIVAGIVKGDIDAANVPCNLAANIYSKTKGGVEVTAINTLSVLYVVETGSGIQSVADLKGKHIYSTGKNATPQYALEYILAENDIDPANDITIEYLSEPAEVVAKLAADSNAAAVLPQPFVAVAQSKNENLRTALSFADAWTAADPETSLVTGVTIIRKDALANKKGAVDKFLADYEDSVKWVTDEANIDTAAQYIADQKFVPSAETAKAALPNCSIVFIKGEEMKKLVSGYLSVLGGQDIASIGGELPKDDFYAA